jgi:hypothetical protein
LKKKKSKGQFETIEKVKCKKHKIYNNQTFFEKHVERINNARVKHELKQVAEDLKPGSGKIWKN